MSAICIIDTSVFVEILNLPQMAKTNESVLKELEKKIQHGEKLFLPMATILETGNHIAKNGSGDQRRQCAERFVKQLKKVLMGKTPFNPIRYLNKEDMQKWISEFPESAMCGIGLGDLSIIQDWKRMCEQFQGYQVYIWSLDQHLQGHNKGPSVKS